MGTKKGFLMVTMAPPPTMEDEFNDWYDMEHIPERKAVSGFETVQRYVCVNGFPRYMAAYDLASQGVLTDQEYQSISGSSYSPWTQRILRRARGLWRVAGEQVYPGDAHITCAPRLLLLHYAAVPAALEKALIEANRTSYEQNDAVIQLRIMRYEMNAGAAIGYVAMIEGTGDLSAIRGPAVEGEIGRHIVVNNEYTRYWAYALDEALGKVVDE